MTTQEILKRAKKAAPSLRKTDGETRNRYLYAMAESLTRNVTAILDANGQDVLAAQDTISPVMIDRLRLTEERIGAMADGIRAVAELPDPIGRILSREVRPNGLVIEKTAVPLGVIAIIYESRPNVTSDAAALALKSGNACVLRGGKEAFRSANAVANALREGLCACGADEDLIQLVQDTTRQSATELMTAVDYVDLLIPRGGAGLIRACVENATVPCIQTGTGICHIYADASADLQTALRIVENAKTSRPSVCNAAEVLLVHIDLAPSFLPALEKLLRNDRIAQGKPPVEFRACPSAAQMLTATPAGESDFDTEFLDYILAVRIVNGIDEAIEHIALHSTGHSEAILTESEQNAEQFLLEVDSAAVYVNASTRFTDGGEFGLGCEMGISTQKLHARGPMGLQELTAYKYVIRGDGQIR